MSPTPEIPSAIEPLPADFTAHEALLEAGWMGKIITAAARLFAVGILIAMAILVVEVVLRYLFNAPTVWAHETTTFLSAVTFIYGGLYCVARNSHIRVVLIYDVVRSPIRRVLDILISIACLCASLFFAWAAWIMAMKAIYRPDGSFSLETSGSAWNPPMPALLKLFLLAVLLTMSVQFLILTINYARGLTLPKRAENA